MYLFILFLKFSFWHFKSAVVTGIRGGHDSGHDFGVNVSCNCAPFDSSVCKGPIKWCLLQSDIRGNIHKSCKKT